MYNQIIAKAKTIEIKRKGGDSIGHENLTSVNHVFILWNRIHTERLKI